MRNKGRLLQIVLTVLASFWVGFYIGTKKIEVDWRDFSPYAVVSSKNPPSAITNLDFSLFWDVWGRLENSFYDKRKIDYQKMLNGAIEGMVQSLGDPFTVYLPPTQNENFKQGLAGQFTGIGAELGTRNDQIIVISPLDGSPAQKSGIKAGDAIVKVDQELTANWSLSKAVEKIRGQKGTKVTLSVIHKDATESEDITITRDVITTKSVSGWVKKIKYQSPIQSGTNIKNKIEIIDEDEKCDGCPKVAYIRISQFGDDTNKEWVSLINSLALQIQSDLSIKGLILDLRNNPGGYLTDAVFIASEFLKQGDVVVKQEGSETTEDSSVTRQGLFLDIPLIVLINKGSASASEIVAAAVGDSKRGILVGETSFGKGSIQQAHELKNGGGVHITVAKWLTPKGTWVNGKGLKPDIEIELDEKAPERDLQLEKAVEELVK